MSDAIVGQMAEATALGIASSVARSDKLGANVLLNGYFADLRAMGVTAIEGWSVLARYQVSLLDRLLDTIRECDIDPAGLLADIALEQQSAHAN